MVHRRLKRVPLYEGDDKVIFEGPEPGTLVHHFKDEASFSDRKGVIQGKGVLNNRISEMLMSKLGEMGIPTHFVRRLNMREQLVKALDMLPLKVVVRNYAAGKIVSHLDIEEGSRLPRTIVEFHRTLPSGESTFLSEDHITAFGWASPQEIEEMIAISYRVNDFLTGLFFGIGVRLIDFRLEFGRFYADLGDDARLVIAGEITPDNCRLWDLKSNEKMDKDRFRHDLGNECGGYQEISRRLGLWGHEIMSPIPQNQDNDEKKIAVL